MEQNTTATFHHTLNDLPLSRFIDCLVDNNLSSLIISGFPNPTELQGAWADILAEYADVTGQHEYSMYKNLYKDTAVIKINLDLINAAVGILREIYSEYFETELGILLNIKLNLDWNDQEKYQHELTRCLNRSKSLKIKYDLKMMEFEALKKRHEQKNTGEKIDRLYFTKILIALSNHAKYQISETIKMGEYCLRLKEYNDYCDYLNRTK
jgi:hypothetical protein